jgi:hypothetical protein
MISKFLWVFLGLFLVITHVSGCTTALHSGSKVSDKIGVAFEVYVATGKVIQEQVCCGNLLTVQRSRQLREAEGWYITHDCERAKTEGGLVCD